MSNHVHMLVVVQDPAVVKDFVAYIKRESAHVINRLMSRSKHTVWCEGYDSPTIIDAETAIERIVYLYSNPLEASLTESIEEYPHLNSWEYFQNGGGEINSYRISRNSIPEIPEGDMSEEDNQAVLEHLLAYKGEKYSIFIDPDHWMSCFKDIDDPHTAKAVIEERVREKERSLERSSVVGKKELVKQQIRKPYRPKRRGKRMVCLGSSKSHKATFFKLV